MIMILSTEYNKSKTNKLSLWPFWNKNHLIGYKYIPDPKLKILLIFVSKGQRVNIVLGCDWPHSVWTKSLVCKDVIL
jgi:hypothetical protein